MQTRAARPDRPLVDLRKLVGGFLRMAPDVAIVGEVRDREALPLLLTLSSGVKGFTTIHAGSARQALTRLRFVAQLSDEGASLPMSALNTLVSEAIDVVVYCMRGGQGPRVTEILAVEDLVAGPEATQFTVTDVFVRRGPDQPLEWSGNVPVRLGRAFEIAGLDISRPLHDGSMTPRRPF
jgi:pilus assembly protein CpaF